MNNISAGYNSALSYCKINVDITGKRPEGLGTSSRDTHRKVSFQYYNIHIVLIWQKCSMLDKTCQKNTMGTFLRHLKQALWYLASNQQSCILQNYLWWPCFFTQFCPKSICFP